MDFVRSIASRKGLALALLLAPATASVAPSAACSAAAAAAAPVLLQTHRSLSSKGEAAGQWVQQPGSDDRCFFPNGHPGIPYYWDLACVLREDSLGCLADGENRACRFCGKGEYSSVPCPGSWCAFDNEPNIPYYWDSSCTMGQVGCKADGKSVQCRFCGEFPYNGTVPCPASPQAVVPKDVCDFPTTPMERPKTPFFWDASCTDGMKGCLADGKHVGCRWCGTGAYADIKCPNELCTFPPEGVAHRYYWDEACWNGSADKVLGCKADGIHQQCRFCGSETYESVECPTWASPN